MEKTIQEFLACWARFEKRLKHKLYETAESRKLNYKKVCAILKKEQAIWENEEHPCGKWLMSLSEADAEKGAQVTNILTENLSLSSVELKKGFPTPVKILAPILGGLVCLAIAKALGAGVLICIASFLSPLIVLAALMKNIGEIVREKNTDSYILNYLEQLKTYKEFVLEMLKKEELE